MSQFQTKFQVGDVVTLNPNIPSIQKWASEFEGQRITVVRYESGANNPYHLSNRIVAKANELVKVDEGQPQAETQAPSTDEELDTSEFPKPSKTVEPIVPIDYFNKAIELTGLKIGDKVRFDFAPNGDMVRQLGGGSVLLNWLGNDRHYKKVATFVGKEAIVTNINDSGYIYFYDEEGELQCYPTIGLSIVKRGVRVAEFQASEDRDAVVLETCVILDEISFSFEFFDKLWEYIKEHQKSPKSGYARNYDISKRHGRGVLHDDYIQVGCQQFKFKDVKRLMAAIRVARSL